MIWGTFIFGNLHPCFQLKTFHPNLHFHSSAAIRGKKPANKQKICKHGTQIRKVCHQFPHKLGYAQTDPNQKRSEHSKTLTARYLFSNDSPHPASLIPSCRIIHANCRTYRQEPSVRNCATSPDERQSRITDTWAVWFRNNSPQWLYTRIDRAWSCRALGVLPAASAKAQKLLVARRPCWISWHAPACGVCTNASIFKPHHIYIYKYVSGHLHVCTYACMHACMHACTCLYVCMDTWMHVCMYACM